MIGITPTPQRTYLQAPKAGSSWKVGGIPSSDFFTYLFIYLFWPLLSKHFIQITALPLFQRLQCLCQIKPTLYMCGSLIKSSAHHAF